VATFHVLTLFPELLEAFSSIGLVGRAVADDTLSLHLTHLRSHAVNDHGQVDDTPYGGGAGMVLRTDAAIPAIREIKANYKKPHVIHFSPKGRVLSQADFERYAADATDGTEFILLCSRYEGVDQRIIDAEIDEELSLGDFVIQGGELAAMAFIEGVSRLLPSVLGNPDSVQEESFNDNRLEAPSYTKPEEFEGLRVPEVLTTGNHRRIDEWRRAKSIEETIRLRPELLAERAKPVGEISIALVHHPVLDKQGKEITSSITLLDVSDIARSARTFGLSKFYVVHPTKVLRKLTQKIHQHWDTGYGATYNPNRKEALDLMAIVPDLDAAILDIETRTGTLPQLITTSAKPHQHNIDFTRMRATLATDERPHLILLGTGWGLAPSIFERATHYLEPINGPTGYNHLSVRSAAAIIMERLFA